MNRNRILILAALALFCLAAKPLHAAETIQLAGEWRFALDRADVGVGEKWFAKDLPDKIQLPGILQAQGYGDDISTNTPGCHRSVTRGGKSSPPACATIFRSRAM